ncbi:MAG TPA: AsnC family protein [Acetobacteraceae bacterium]|nr:AsnC family protein [Acetobacteraceae bacterium]
MQRRLYWTQGQDTQIRRRRIEGASWETIAAELSLHVRVVIARARRLGIRMDPITDPPPEDPLREPLPAGHPRTWRALTAGTVLQSERYPLRHFRR